MKIVCDFDGVLTDPTVEAARLRDEFRRLLAAAGAIDRAAIDEALERAEQAVAAAPADHGWSSAGRLSAFADEDPFVFAIAVADRLDALAGAGHEPAATLGRSLGDGGFAGAAGRAFTRIARAAERIVPIDAAAGPTIGALRAAGIEIVIVSNSEPDTIRRRLAAAGIEGASFEPDGSPFRVRGGARKFELGLDPQAIALGDRRVDVDRPAYRRLLLEERPDLVVGDVVSLDLALPHHLGVASALLRRRPYTPPWALEAVAGRDQRLGLLDDFADLTPARVRSLAP